jgi:hypothetical protein
MVNNQIYCETCCQPIVDYKVTLTKRNLIWLMALGHIGKYDKANENNWVNYREVQDLVAKHFGKWVDGKWKPMLLTAYGCMSDNPWWLIENHNESKQKFRSKGDWRLTQAGIQFLRNEIQVPEMAWFRHDGCYKTSRMVYARELKGVNFQELTDLFNSF